MENNEPHNHHNSISSDYEEDQVVVTERGATPEEEDEQRDGQENSPSTTTIELSLLQEERQKEQHDNEERKVISSTTPLPKLQMIIISLIIIAEAVGYALLYPVVPFMVRDFLVYEQMSNVGLNHTVNTVGNSRVLPIISIFGFNSPIPITSVGTNFEGYTIMNTFTNSTFGNHTDTFEIPEETVGLMIGALSSAFSFAQLISNWFIARGSDHIGRKPLLLSGLIFNIIFMSIFSVSRNFWFALSIRIVHGFLNANIPIYKSFLMDITDNTNQEKAFVIISILWAVSNITTPGVGGFLVDFAGKFPVLFGGEQSALYKFFKANPYILPFSIPVIMNIVTLILAIFLLKESLTKRFNILDWIKIKLGKKKLEENSIEMVESETSLSVVDDSQDNLIKLTEGHEQQTTTEISKPSSQNSILFLLKDSTVVKVVSLYLFLGIFSNMADELVPIFFSNSVKKRGLGLDSLSLGLILSVGGVTSLVMLIIYPKLSKKFGFLWLYRIGLVIYGITILILPFSTEMIRFDFVFWIVMCFVTFFIFIKSCSHSIIYTSQFLMVNNASPSPEHIGSMNGLGHICASIGWAIGPFACGLLVDLGLKFSNNIEEIAPNSFFAKVPFVDKLSFVVCALICFFNLGLSFTVPNSSITSRRYEKEKEIEQA